MVVVELDDPVAGGQGMVVDVVQHPVVEVPAVDPAGGVELVDQHGLTTSSTGPASVLLMMRV